MNDFAKCAQLYFPPQIVFSPDNGQTISAIDEINQRAYTKIKYGSDGQETAFAMEHFPYAIPHFTTIDILRSITSRFAIE